MSPMRSPRDRLRPPEWRGNACLLGHGRDLVVVGRDHRTVDIGHLADHVADPRHQRAAGDLAQIFQRNALAAAARRHHHQNCLSVDHARFPSAVAERAELAADRRRVGDRPIGSAIVIENLLPVVRRSARRSERNESWPAPRLRAAPRPAPCAGVPRRRRLFTTTRLSFLCTLNSGPDGPRLTNTSGMSIAALGARPHRRRCARTPSGPTASARTE